LTALKLAYDWWKAGNWRATQYTVILLADADSYCKPGSIKDFNVRKFRTRTSYLLRFYRWISSAGGKQPQKRMMVSNTLQVDVVSVTLHCFEYCTHIVSDTSAVHTQKGRTPYWLGQQPGRI
jgi:hypothetical protein